MTHEHSKRTDTSRSILAALLAVGLVAAPGCALELEPELGEADSEVIIIAPDLIPVDIASPMVATPGQDISPNLGAWVLNDSLLIDSGGFFTSWVLSVDPVVDPSDFGLLGGREWVTGVPAGTVVTVPVSGGTIPTTVSPGVYHLIFVADELNHIAEAVETNNTMYSLIEIL